MTATEIMATLLAISIVAFVILPIFVILSIFLSSGGSYMGREKKVRQASSQTESTLIHIVMGVRLRALYAHACSENHDYTELSPELKDLLDGYTKHLSEWLESSEVEEPSRLWEEIKSAILTPVEDKEELPDLLNAFIAQTDSLNRELGAEIVNDCLSIASIHGPTAKCIRLLREISKALGYKIRKKRKTSKKPKPETSTEEPGSIADALGYYALMELPTDADLATIKAAYRRLAFELHPDRSSKKNATQTFQQLNEANSVLSDPIKRAEYDQL